MSPQASTRVDKDAARDKQIYLFRTLIVEPIDAELAQKLEQNEGQKKTTESSDLQKLSAISI